MTKKSGDMKIMISYMWKSYKHNKNYKNRKYEDYVYGKYPHYTKRADHFFLNYVCEHELP